MRQEESKLAQLFSKENRENAERSTSGGGLSLNRNGLIGVLKSYKVKKKKKKKTKTKTSGKVKKENSQMTDLKKHVRDFGTREEKRGVGNKPLQYTAYNHYGECLQEVALGSEDIAKDDPSALLVHCKHGSSDDF